jgi:hypothetical protein
MPEHLKYRKHRDGYIIRSADKFGDVAKVYNGDDSLRYTKMFVASPELIEVAKKVESFLEILLSAEKLDPESFSETVNKKYIKDLCKAQHHALKRLE